MTVPMWVLLGFAGWTLSVLIGSVGLARAGGCALDLVSHQMILA